MKWQYAYRTTGGYGNWTDIPGSSAATTRHVVSGLANGTAHTFKIRAVNDVGPGAESKAASSTPLSRPAKPSGFTAKAGDALVALAWNDPLNSTITGWQYSFRTSGNYGPWTDIEGSHRATTGHSVAGLSNGVEHTFKIRAVNASGGGEESDSVSATPQPVPEKPSGLRAEAGNTQARLFWTDPDDSTISGWQYRFRTGEDYGAWMDMPASSSSTVRHTVTGLANNTAHTFRVRALNASGAGAESDEAAATPREAVPAKPTGFRTKPGDSEVSLTWDDPDDASIQGWQFKSRKSDGEYKAQWDNVPGSDAKTVRHTVTGLENGATYIFKIRAFNAANGHESGERSAAPRSLRPDAPTGLNARPGDAEVALAWDDPGDPAITGWQYAVRTTGGFGEWTDIPGSDAATTAYTATALENGVRHVFKLRAVNEYGGGAESGEVSATPLAVPAKPTGFTATPGDGRVSLQWSDPGNATITGWQYALKTTGNYGAWTDIAGSGAATTDHTVTGLDNGTAHGFKLRALNASGNGAESDEVAATPVAVPAKPTGFTATPGDGQIALAWDDPGNATITGWQYRYDAGSGYGEWADIPGSGAATTAHTVTGLDNGTAHGFKLRALNASGNGAESDEIAATPLAVPAKPTGFTATPGDGRIALAWDDPVNATITGWQYVLKTTGSYGPWTDIPGSDAGTTAHTMTGLDNGVVHRFKLRAVNASGKGAESGEATARPVPVPAKPTGLTATAGDGRISLQWADPDDDTITGWQYRYRTTGGYGDWTDIDGSGAETTSHAVTELANGVVHRFEVRAVNGSGPGAPSGEAAATPLAVPAKPAGLTATPGSGEVVLEWNDPMDPSITAWEYNRRLEDEDYEEYWTTVAGSRAATRSLTVIGLDIGASYRFKLRAGNASGPGPESDEIAVTLPPVPAKPAGLAAAAGDRRVSLEWTALDDSTVTGWQYRYRTGGVGYGSWTDIPDSGEDTTAHTVTGLTPGVLHHFRIRAANSSGEGVESDEAAATPFAVPAKPAGLTATPGSGEALLEWDDPNNPAITGWEYNQRQGEDEFGEEWTAIGNSGPATTGHTVIGLAVGVTYAFKVRAVAGDRLGTESDEVTATVTLPNVPARATGLTATAGDQEVALGWSDPNDPTVTGWQYKIRTTGNFGDWIDVPGSGAQTTAHTVTGLEYGVNYTFKVRALNTGGNGEESGEATATSLPARPTGFTATAGDRQVLLEWDDPGDPSVTHWEYKQRQTDEPFANEWTVLPKDATPTRVTVPNLEIGASYAFKLRAVNAGGAGAETGEVATTVPPVPARPEGFALIPGEREVSLEWKALGDPTVTVWQYKYRIGSNDGGWTDIPGSGPDTNGYTVTGLEAGVSHKFRIRAANSSGFGLASDEIATAPLGRPARPTGLTATPGYGQVVLTWSDPGDPAIVRWQYVVRTEEDRAPDKWLDMAGSGPRTRRYVVEALESGVAYIFRIRVCASEDRRHPVCGPGSDPVSATPKAAATPAERRTVKAVLAGLAGHVAAGADAMIGMRFSADPAQSSVVLAGREVPLFARGGEERMRAPPGGAPRETVRGIGGRELLQNSSFQVALGPPEGEGFPQWSLWHRGDLTRFEGSAGAGSRYGGRLLSFWYGADMQWDKRWLAGAALARSKAEVDYAGGGGASHLKTVLDSVHPYLLRRFEDGGTAWITLGGGRGTIENETAGRDIETADTELATASAGFRARLPAFGGLELSASGAAGFAQLEADGNARTAIGSLSASTDHLSLGVEAALEEGEAAYYTSLSLRRNGGDGVRGLGLELSGGAGSPLPASSGRVDIRLRGLVWHSGREYREFGLTATVRQPADAGRGGPSWSLAGAYGTPASGSREPEPLWSRGAPKRGGKAMPTLDLKAGWRFVFRHSLFEPHAALGLAGVNGRQLRLGVDMGPPAGPVLTLAAERRAPQTGSPESRISAALQFRF